MRNRKISLRTSRAARLVSGMLTVCLCLGAATQVAASSQQAQRPADESAPTKPVEVIIAPSEVVLQAQKVRAELQTIRTLLQLRQSVQNIERELPPFVNTIGREYKEFEALDIAHQSFRKLMQIRGGWVNFRVQTEAWQRGLRDRSLALEDARAKLIAMRELWEKTQAVSLVEQYAESLQERIRAVIKEIEDVEQRLRARLEAVFSLQDQVSTQFSTIIEVLNALDTTSETLKRRLFSQDSPPLWKAVFAREAGAPLAPRIKELWRQKVEALQEFLTNNLARLIVHLVAFISLGLLFISLRRHSHDRLGKEESLQASKHILFHPFSVALILALMFRIWIYPQSPQIVVDLFRLILVIPLLRLLPGLAPAELRRPIYGLGGLYVLQMIGEVLPAGSFAERLLMLTLTLLALGGMIWLVKPGGVLRCLPNNRWSRSIATFFRLSVLFFAVSTVSNILGNMSLSDLLAQATILSIYGLVLIVLAVLVIDGLIFLILRSRAVQTLRMVRLYNEMWYRGARRFVRLFALFFWLYLTVQLFDVFRPVRDLILGVLASPLSIGTLSISLGDILAFVITVIVSIYLAKAIRFVLNEDVLPRFHLPRGVPAAVSFVAYYFILFAGFILALGAAGIEWSRFAILAGALGVGIGFGLQNLVNNFVSGLILIFERPIKVGDFIEFAGQRGEVLRIGIRSSTVRTWEGAEIIVPNGNLISSEVINWTLSDRKRRLMVPVGVAYGTDPDTVMQILKKVAGDHPNVLKDPEPIPLFMGFGESSLDFEIRFSIREYLDWVQIRSEMNLAIHVALRSAGIEIPFPQRDLHVRSAEPLVIGNKKRATNPQPKSPAAKKP